MNKKYRDGFDVKVAFSSGGRRLMNDSGAKQGAGLSENPGPQRSQWPLTSGDVPQQGRIKTLLKVPARFVYRLVKPALRPITFRLRRYFIDEFRDQVLQETRQASAAILHKVEEANSALRLEMSEAHNQMLEEARQTLGTILNKVEEASLASSSLLNAGHVQLSNMMASINRTEHYCASSARRVAINCGDSEVLVRTQVGYLLCPSADPAVLSCLIETGDLEIGTRLLIQKYLNPGDVFIDVGANLGLHTLAAARAMSGQGKIIAFEPFEPTKKLLEKSIWMNGFSAITDIHQAAVSNVSGAQLLHLGSTVGHHSLFPLEGGEDLTDEPVEVPLVRLDEIVGENQRVDLIKVDVEGAELEVLESAQPVILNNPEMALIIEFGPSHLKRTGHSTRQWLETFADHGLVYKAIEPETGELLDWSVEQLEEIDSINLFFARKESPAWERATQ